MTRSGKARGVVSPVAPGAREVTEDTWTSPTHNPARLATRAEHGSTTFIKLPLSVKRRNDA